MAGKVEGLNSRLDELQAALLRVKLKSLRDWNQRRKKLADLYNQILTPAARGRLPYATEPDTHVFHLYVVTHSDRDGLQSHLTSGGIDTMIHYPDLLHQQELFRRPGQTSLPVAESLLGQMLSLPLYPQLGEDEVATIARAILEFENE